MFQHGRGSQVDKGDLSASVDLSLLCDDVNTLLKLGNHSQPAAQATTAAPPTQGVFL